MHYKFQFVRTVDYNIPQLKHVWMYTNEFITHFHDSDMQYLLQHVMQHEIRYTPLIYYFDLILHEQREIFFENNNCF